MSGSSLCSWSFKGAQLDSEKNIEATIMHFVKILKSIVDRIGARNRQFIISTAEAGEKNEVQNLRKKLAHKWRLTSTTKDGNEDIQS